MADTVLKNPLDNYSELRHAGAGAGWLAVNWCLTNVCNYRCTYCAESLHNGSMPIHDFEKLKEFCNLIHAGAGGKNLFFEFSGGEVTYLKYFGPLLKHISSLNGVAGIISNGSSPVEWWKEHVQYAHSVALSLHAAQLKNFDHFLEVARVISESANTYLHINVMMDPAQIDKCFSYADILREEIHGSMALQPLLDGFGTHRPKFELDYTDEQRQRMALFQGRWKEKNIPAVRGALHLVRGQQQEFVSTYDLLMKNMTDFRGWKCNAGVENIAIDLGGDIYRGWCWEGGKIGNINDGVYPFRRDPVVCGSSFCSCGFDLGATKFRNS
jgi:MoaA/NifB/PqqE/SkfB family radical SAM enzyme